MADQVAGDSMAERRAEWIRRALLLVGPPETVYETVGAPATTGRPETQPAPTLTPFVTAATQGDPR
jgi:hypothetical protein